MATRKGFGHIGIAGCSAPGTDTDLPLLDSTRILARAALRRSKES